MAKDWERRSYRWAHTVLPYAVVLIVLVNPTNHGLWFLGVMAFFFSAVMMRVLSVRDLKELAPDAERILTKLKPKQKTLEYRERETDQ